MKLKENCTVFFDTEFTGLFENADLISIGLIDKSGTRSFYAESSGSWHVEACSEFCHAEVLPLLEGGERALPLEQLRQELRRWLETLGSQVTLLSDSPRDIDQLEKLFPQGLPANVHAATFGHYDRLTRWIFNGEKQIHQKHGWRVHHALDDAKANRLACLKGRLHSEGWK